MTRIWTGTAAAVSGYTTIALSGDPLTAANCPLDATIVLGGATYFVGEADYSNMIVELTRPYEGVDGTVSAEIDPLTVVTATVGNLAREITDYNARLALLDAYGKGLFYTILGMTGANDPGPGKVGRDATDWADVTALYFDDLDAGGYSAEPFFDTWEANVVITVRSIETRAYAAYRLLDDPNDQTGWRSVLVDYIGGDGMLADGEDVSIAWNPLAPAGIITDASVDTLGELALYSNEVAGFRVLVSDSGDGRAGVFTLDTSASPADWIGPAILQGPQGETGLLGTWRSQWLTSTAYALLDIVQQGGSSYICVIAHTSGSFATDLAALKWEVVASPGLSREKLSAARSYYVRPDGSDSNDGLSNTSGGAFLTPPKAIDVVCGDIDFGGQTVTINVADGTYTAGFTINKSWTGGGALAITGNAGSPGNVIISVTGGHAVRWQGALPSVVTLSGFELRTTTSGDCIRGEAAGQITYSNIIFGTCAGSHLHAVTQGARLSCGGNYTISGGAQRHWNIGGGSMRSDGRTITLSGTPAFSSQFAFAELGGIMQVNSCTFVGSATGTRYLAETAGGIQTGGGGASYLPGNAGGSVTTPGWYA